MDSGRHAGQGGGGERPKYAAGLDYELPPMGVWSVAIKGADSKNMVSHSALRHTHLLHMSHFCCFPVVFWMVLKQHFHTNTIPPISPN